MIENLEPRVSIGYFISPHGFGHAARAAAVINAIYEKWPFIHAELFTTVPECFFKDTLCAPFSYHLFDSDIGMVQRSPFEIDLEATVARLDETYPMPDDELEKLAVKLQDLQCLLVISDISPWGIAAAKKGDLPSMLIENFTWDWIYESYLLQFPRLKAHVKYLSKIFSATENRIQAVPYCLHSPGACLEVPPIGRKPFVSRQAIRDRLGLEDNEKMVLITMGGIPEPHRFLHQLTAYGQKIHFVVPGVYSEVPPEGERRGNATLVPHRSFYYHPDLVNAADAVVGKAGYSTLAEVYYAGVPYGYVTRSNFRESDILEAFINEKMSSLPITQAEFKNGAWLEKLPELLTLPGKLPVKVNGADAVADYVCRFVASRYELLDVVDAKG